MLVFLRVLGPLVLASTPLHLQLCQHVDAGCRGLDRSHGAVQTTQPRVAPSFSTEPEQRGGGFQLLAWRATEDNH